MEYIQHQEGHDFGFLFWAHLTIIITSYISWLLFDWRIVVFGVAIVFLQWLIFKGCIISAREINAQEWDDSWLYHYSKKIGIKANKRRLHIFSTYISPIAIVLAAIVWQVMLNHKSFF